LALDDKYDDIKKLIDTGKEKGYLTYDQVNDLIPHDVHSPEDLDDLLTTIGTQGIDVLEGPKMPSSALDKKFEEAEEGAEDVELDLTPGALEKTNDPVRMYLREMGTVPLLTREGEVEIAKRIERGQLRVLKALSRSPIVIHELLAMGDDLKKGVRSIKEVVTFDEEEITDDILQNRLKEFTGKIDELAKHYKKAGQLQEKFALVSQKKRPKDHRKYRMALGRGIVRVSLAVRTLGFTNNERKRLIERVNKTVDGMRSLDRQAQNLERKADATRSEDQKKRIPAPGPRNSRGNGKAGTGSGRVVPGTQAHPARDHPGRHGRRARQARAHRSQPPPGGLDCQEVHESRTAVPRPDSGRQHRPDESRGQVRIPPWLQVFDVRHVVDSAGDYPCHC